MIVEINGVKMEIDERQAKTIDHYKVGDTVKVLTKDYSSWKVSWGVIVGFANFKTHPSIEVLKCSNEYGSPDIKVLTINKDTEDVQIAPANDYEPEFKAAGVVDRINTEIQNKLAEVYQLERKRNAFLKYFGHIVEKENRDD